MVASSPADIAKRVQEALNAAGPPGERARVLATEVRPGTDGSSWWWVPVSYREDPRTAYLLYDTFSCIEEQLKSDGLDVLLVPRVLRTERDES